MVLAQTIFRLRIARHPAVDIYLRKETGIILLIEHLPFLLRENLQIIQNQIQIISPVIAPVALSEVPVHKTLRKINDLEEQRFIPCVAEHLLHLAAERSRRKCLCGKRGQFLSLPLIQPLKQLSCRLRLQLIGHLLYTERVVTVQLDQTVKFLDILPSHKRGKKGIAPPVLIHIPEVAVALRIELRQHGKIVVIPLQIAVLSGINIKYFIAAKPHRIAAS